MPPVRLRGTGGVVGLSWTWALGQVSLKAGRCVTGDPSCADAQVEDRAVRPDEQGVRYDRLLLTANHRNRIIHARGNVVRIETIDVYRTGVVRWKWLYQKVASAWVAWTPGVLPSSNTWR